MEKESAVAVGLEPEPFMARSSATPASWARPDGLFQAGSGGDEKEEEEEEAGDAKTRPADVMGETVEGGVMGTEPRAATRVSRARPVPARETGIPTTVQQDSADEMEETREETDPCGSWRARGWD